tara:strand:+ start:1236 stop:1796 length:561 start_codon:yes stop_codon:yes gene_type:complete
MNTIIFAFDSGAFDHGTSTGKGKFQLDLTLNPFNKFQFGQSYFVIGYGITENLDLHGYISNHYNGDFSYYGGVYYQFINNKIFDLASAVGFRKKIEADWVHLFFPQLLYSIKINKKIKIGGSIVNVKDLNKKVSFGNTLDIGVYYLTNYQSETIESLSICISAFHPVTWEPKQYFLPTYSIDIKFK